MSVTTERDIAIARSVIVPVVDTPIKLIRSATGQVMAEEDGYKCVVLYMQSVEETAMILNKGTLLHEVGIQKNVSLEI